MIALSNNTIKKLQDQIKKEKIVFWKDETHVFLQKKKITFLYNDYESLNIHIKIMTEDEYSVLADKDPYTFYLLEKSSEEE